MRALLTLVAAVLVASVLPAAASAATTELQLSPGHDTSSQRNFTFAAKTTYTITVSGTMTTKYGAEECVHDFAYQSCNAGSWVNNGTGIRVVNTPGNSEPGQAFADFANPRPAYREDHTYTFTFTQDAQRPELALWALPQGHPSPQGTSYEGGFTVRFDFPDAAATPPPPRGCGPARSARAAQVCLPPDECGQGPTARAAAITEVRVTRIVPGVEVRKTRPANSPWCPPRENQVLGLGDEISTDPDGEVELTFADGATVVIRHSTQLRIATLFSEGGVTRTQLILTMGEISLKVNKSRAPRSDFRIKSPTVVASVRGTGFRVFHDPASKASLVSVDEGVVRVDPVRGGLRTVDVGAGREVEVTPSSITPPARIGRAGARGGINRLAALNRVLAIVARGNTPCG